MTAERDRASLEAGSIRPRHGGRIQLDGRIVEPGTIRYDLALATPNGAWATRVRVVRADGAVCVDGWRDGDEPPAWLLTFAQSVLRTLWKERKGEGAEPWPERIYRWREAKPVASG